MGLQWGFLFEVLQYIRTGFGALRLGHFSLNLIMLKWDFLRKPGIRRNLQSVICVYKHDKQH